MGQGAGRSKPKKSAGALSTAWPPARQELACSPHPVVLWGRRGAGARGPGMGSLAGPWAVLGVAALGWQPLYLMFVHYSSWQGCGSQTALPEALFKDSSSGFSFLTVVTGKSAFPQALLLW